MRIEHYVFALFVAALLALLIFLADRLRRSRKGAEQALKEKERRILRLYENLEDMINGVEAYVEEAKEEIEGTKKQVRDMLTEAEGFKKNSEFGIKGMPQQPLPFPAKGQPDGLFSKFEPVETEPELQEYPEDIMDVTEDKDQQDGYKEQEEKPDNLVYLPTAVKEEPPSKSKAQKVLQLKDEGMSLDQIARELGVSRAEVTMILNRFH